jgi:hypothetical protein
MEGTGLTVASCCRIVLTYMPRHREEGVQSERREGIKMKGREGRGDISMGYYYVFRAEVVHAMPLQGRPVAHLSSTCLV